MILHSLGFQEAYGCCGSNSETPILGLRSSKTAILKSTWTPKVCKIMAFGAGF